MSIFAYAGMPRSGKSYNAVANVIMPALRQGRTVVTNIPLYADKIRETVSTGKIVEFPIKAVMQNPDTIKDYVKPGCVFVLDEVWRIWPAGDKANRIPEVYKSLLAEHGHMVDTNGDSVQIVLVVQDLSNISAFARKLVEQTFIHTKLTHVGADSRFRVDIFHGPVTGTIGPQNNRLREIFGQYEPAVYELYKSHTMSQAKADGANEKLVDRRGNVLKRPIFIVVIPLVLALAGFALWHLMGEAKKFEHPKVAGPGYLQSMK